MYMFQRHLNPIHPVITITMYFFLLQALSFLLLASFTVALLILFSAALPISHPMTLGGDHLIWILWVVAPLLATSFLASPADGSLMKRTPEKNDPKVSKCLSCIVHAW